MPSPPSATADLIADDGIRLRTLRWDPAAPADGLPPVVLQHGFAASTQLNWAAPGIVDALLAAGRQAVGIDARRCWSTRCPTRPCRSCPAITWPPWAIRRWHGRSWTSWAAR